MCAENVLATMLMLQAHDTDYSSSSTGVAPLERVWSGRDRSGNLIAVTRDAFGMAGRLHVWRLGIVGGDSMRFFANSVVADNVTEFPEIEIPSIEI